MKQFEPTSEIILEALQVKNISQTVSAFLIEHSYSKEHSLHMENLPMER